ncbi:AraC family transcriptional regulator [Variovorax sp. OV329]|uniref:helix-turn-helix transcriptional regulator n=1 Tax=Variovorax sp. OV329 TaxID=1882825 RepID=UPI0008E85C99|nr:AraC family transcriptional regulator [Variovorax sp. OV329]SFM64550.1 AraC-type DNA-binding protein [Variovorax sp. OV329]
MIGTRPAWLPAATVRNQLQGLATLGLDMGRLRVAVGPIPEGADALVPQQTYLTLWREAQDMFGDEALPTALAMAIPFGAFGALDYLVGSAETLGGGVESARLHFAMVASDVWLDLHHLEDGTHVVQVRGLADLTVVPLEFTLASIFGRLRHLSGGRFTPLRVGLPLARPLHDPIRERIYGTSIRYHYPCAEIAISADDWDSACIGADPYLHSTLNQLAKQLQAHRPADSALESAVRMRLRGALAQGQADVDQMARLLGVSERTLQRRLSEIDRSYTQIVEDYRREESARLLSDRSLHLTEVASRLGYAEQTSFTRAFRRWYQTTPANWRLGHG